MTRCLYCGAERDSDQCLACGLTTDAAEVMLRRRLVQRTALFLVGSLLFIPISRAFPPLELDGILIFVGGIFFLVLGLGMWMVQRARKRKEIEVLKRIYFGFLPVPWILAGLLFFNGKLDHTPMRHETTSVVGKFSMPGPMGNQRLIVSSWRVGREFEHVQVSRDDYNRFQIGDKVIIDLQTGMAGIAWVYAVYRP